MKKQRLKKIVDEIVAGLPLNEKTFFSNLDEEGVKILQIAFDLYIKSKTGAEPDDDESNDIMNELWKRLQETHRLRVVK